MGYQIEIVEGHDPSSYFWFRPAKVDKTDKIEWEDVYKYTESEFSIEEGDISCFLAYFLWKYFDKKLIYNKNRYDYDYGYFDYFEWYLTDNFYTYEALEKMCKEILEVASLLEIDYDNPSLDGVKERYSIYYMCDRNSEDYGNNSPEAIKRNIGVVIDFYRRFVDRIRQQMNETPQANIVSIMGP